MMEDRGYAISAREHELTKMMAIDVASDALHRADQENISFGRALTSYYERLSAKEGTTEGTLKKNVESAFVVFVDRIYDNSKNKETMISSALLRDIDQEYSVKCPGCTILVVVPNKLTPDAKKTVLSYKKMQIINCESLFIPVGRHRHVPKHVRLSASESVEFEESRSISRDKLPVLLLSDPVSLYYGYEVGDIIRVDRPSGPFYRTVLA